MLFSMFEKRRKYSLRQLLIFTGILSATEIESIDFQLSAVMTLWKKTPAAQ